MSFIDKIQRGRQVVVPRLIVYGPAGVGKSTFAAGAPNPLIIDVEGRTGHLDVARVQPSSWYELMEALREAPGAGFQTVVIDTLDHAELLLHSALCEKNKWNSIEDPGFGKGYVHAIEGWRQFLVAIDGLRNRGVQPVMLAHAQLRTIKNPAGDDYDVYGLKLKGGAKTSAADLLREKADLVGYAHFEDLTKKANKTDAKAKVLTTGERVLTFSHHPAYETKQGLPLSSDEFPLDWTEYTKAIEQ